MMQRLLEILSERRAMKAYGNVMSGREKKWYAIPFTWVGHLIFFSTYAGIHAYRAFYYIVVPVLVVCGFITMHNMNNKLDKIDSAMNNQAETTTE